MPRVLPSPVPLGSSSIRPTQTVNLYVGNTVLAAAYGLELFTWAALRNEQVARIRAELVDLVEAQAIARTTANK